MKSFVIAYLLIALAVFSSSARAFEPPMVFPPRIYETFDAFPDGYDLRADYPTVNSAAVFAATVTSSNDLYPGIEGKAAEFDPALTTTAVHRIHNDELMILTPEIFGPLVFRADIFDDGVTEFKRATTSIRYQFPGSGSAQNVITMGSPPNPAFPFGHMQSAVASNPLSGWQPFTLPEEMDERVEIGPGWHRFSVTITMTELIYELDLHRDGTVDAQDVVPAILHPIGFNEMRFAKMGPAFELPLIAMDNLFFGVIPEPAAAGMGAMALIALGSQRRRRT